MTYVYHRDRGQHAVSVVIGVMLMVSILFLAAAQYQLVIVPQEEESAEVEHSRLVSSQMGQLHADILAASANDAQSAQKLDVGLEYENDLIFGIIPEVHQPNPSGSIANEEFSDQLVVKNAEGLGSASNYWPGNLDGDECGDPNHCYDTTSFHYSADYNRFSDNPDLIYENTVVYDYYENPDGEDDYQFHSNQNVVQGRELNLVALTGDIEQSRVSPSTIQTIPVSSPAQTVTVEQDETNDPVTVELPTRIPASVWENDLLADQMADENPDGYVESLASCGPDCVELTMVEDEVYNLKLSRVHLTTREERNTVPTEKAAYIAWKGNDKVTIRENSTTEINAQVRDRYNNPVPGINTQAYARDSDDNCIGSFRSGVGNTCTTGGGSTVQQAGEQTSGEDGSLTYYYEAPDVDSDTAISLQLQLADPDNTVSASLSEFSPELTSHTTPASPPPQPSIDIGHLNSDDTLRVTDVAFDETGVTAKDETYAFVTFDNTGTNRITEDVSVTGTGDFQSEPGTVNVDLEPGEHERHAVKVSFRDAGTQTIQFGSHAETIGVRNASTGIAPAVIQNRRAKEQIEKSPGKFKDGDATRDEYQETQNIPPVEYNSSDGTYDETAAGNIYQFSNIGENDSNPAYIDGDASKPVPNSLNVGMVTERVSDNDVYTFFMNYSFANDADNVRYKIVNSTGTVIDSDSNYYLKNEDTDTVRAYQLTDEESSYLRSSNELYLVLESTDTSSSVPQLRPERAWLESGGNSLNLSEPDVSLEDDSISRSDSSVATGERFIVSADITNTGTAATEKQIVLFQSEDGSPHEGLRAKDVYVNPGETKNVQFVLYEYNPGTYDYQIGLENTPDTDPTEIEITHR